jgi:hypothetical protein
MRKFLLAILIFLCLTSTSFAYRCVYSETVRDSAGNIMANATVRAYIETAGTQATIYEEVDSTTSVSSVSTNSDGSFEFYVDRFDYDSDQKFQIIVTKGSSTKTYDDVTIDRVVMGTYAGDKTLTTTLRVPEGVIYSGTITVSTGTIIAGLYQIFSGTVTGLTKAYPEWWTTNATPGTTNMTTALQAAADSLTSGGNLILQPTTYSFTNLTLDNAGVTLQGSGWGSVLESSLAATGDTATAILIQANNVTVKDFELTYANIPTALVATGDWVIENNGIGVGVNPTVADTYYSNVTIDNVYVLGGKTHGICVGRSINTIVKNCRVENVWGTGIWGTHTKDAHIINNYITETEDLGIDMTANGTDPAGTGLAPWVSENVLIQGNILYRDLGGIGCHGPYGCLISDNIIDTTWTYPIVASKDGASGHTTPQNVKIVNNTIIDPWKLYGVGETKANDLVTTSGGVHAAIEAWVDGALTITGNDIYDTSTLTTSYVGIWAGGDSVTATPLTNITLTGNNLYIDAQYGFRIGSYADASAVDQVDNLTMTGNTLVIGSAKGAMALYLNGVKHGTVSGNTFDCGGQTLSDPSGRFVVTNYSEDILITGNKVLNNTGNGYSDSAGSSKISMNGNYGVYDYPTPGWTDKVDTAPTLTIAEILKGIIYGTPTEGRAYVLPTGTLTDASGYFALYGTWDWSIINLAAVTHAITLTAGDDHTIVGNAVVAAASSAGFRTQKTAANTFITYRIH